MSIRDVLLAIACTTLLAGAGPAVAQKGKGADRVCAEDAKKFCSGTKPGGGRVYQCMMSHEAELAPACRERLTAAKARYDEFVAACKGDGEKYCKGIPPGGGRILSCLKSHEGDLSAACKSEFAKARSNRAVTQ